MGLITQQLEVKISVQYFGGKKRRKILNTLLFGLWGASCNFTSLN